MLLVIGLQFINRLTLHYLLYKRSSKSEAVRNILIVGQSSKGLAYMKEIAKYHYLNLNIVGYISIKEPIPYNGIPHLGSVDDLADVATKHVIDEIAVARPLYYDPRLSDVLAQCQIMGITVTMLLDTHNTNEMKVQVAMVGKIPVLKFHSVSLNESQLFVKRLLDIVGSLVGMLMFLLFYVTLGPLIKMETPGPIIFKQDRVGKNGRVFKVWKFRSMGQDAELQKAELQTDNEMTGHMFKMHNDPRVTKIGALMRRTSIDEFPQFYNVLRGDMSLVGTRPPTVEEVASYEQYQLKRISITPGITGNWQVSGRSNIADFEEVLRLDNAYIENWSLWSDLKIIIKTLKVVLSRRGSI